MQVHLHIFMDSDIVVHRRGGNRMGDLQCDKVDLWPPSNVCSLTTLFPLLDSCKICVTGL
jgi:hypothetical protein